MYCSKCGKPNPDNARFCNSCGYDLINNRPNRATNYSNNQIMGYLHTVRPNIPGIIISLAMLVTAFLPIINKDISFKYLLTGNTMKVIDADYGVLVVIIAVVALVLSIFDIGIWFSACGVAGCGVVYLLNQYIENLRGKYFSSKYVTYNDIAGVGYWVLIAVSIAMIVWGLRYKVGRRAKPTRIRYTKGISNLANYNNEEDAE